MINWRGFSKFFTSSMPLWLLLVSVGVLVVALLAGLFSKRVGDKKRYILWLLLVEYVSIVICSTIICRHPIISSFEKIQLAPFWTYKAVLAHIPGVSVWDIVLNVILFLPLGFFVKLLYPKLTLWKMILIAFIASLFIETNQNIFEKGISQFDDVMHNVIGAMMGWGIAAITQILIPRCTNNG